MFKRAAIVFTLVLHGATTGAAAEDKRSLQILVSKDTQSLTVYDGGRAIASSRVSTGKPGHDTPTGIFSILEKRKYHESNIYSNAPMPWMQRLTWSGIALHESGSVPRYPASHGCVRLPADFAKSLYKMTARGIHVIISDRPVMPEPITHASLFAPPAQRPAGDVLSDASLRPSSADPSIRHVEVAMNMPHPPLPLALPKADTATAADEPEPLRILITRRSERDRVADVQAMLTELGFDAGAADGLAGDMTRGAITAYKRWKGLPLNGPLLDDAFLSALYASTGRAAPPAGQLLVRQGFQPVLSEPVGIADPEVALGTFFFTVTRMDRDRGTAAWQGLRLEDDLPQATRKRLGITRMTAGLEEPGSSAGDRTAMQAVTMKAVLDRIHVPAALRARLSEMMSTGTSLTITDAGPGLETTKGTDFITVTHSTPRRASKT
ncbi:L,D-transpeptidase family protein [Rhizobium sp. SSA_523]|uniref:L,D-transpeptidase family protein n=1 Tax=Rhizobium sp. SSA_523 TaxID=2952477 RepID=UPI00209054AD|nr:L,D-transpeptidase family protein [Rhizobium sp. SSA_523]MCO5730626.1 L,D-transpeptidase family protein [Rhizobium sp. SSA_523]WKC24543.1 L,D-transpeptidase family protein [Rhizobium sp. SSA_523]